MPINYENFINVNEKEQIVGVLQNSDMMDGTPIYIGRDCIASYYIEDGKDQFISVKQDKHISDIDMEFVNNNNIKQIILRPNYDVDTIILPDPTDYINKDVLYKSIAANAIHISISISNDNITVEYKYGYITEANQTSKNLRFQCMVYYK